MSEGLPLSSQEFNKPPEKISAEVIRIPQFIAEQQAITSTDALAVARELQLPHVSGSDDSKDVLIGLRFCRGRGIDAQTAISSYKEEALALPRTRGELVRYFDHVTRADVDNAISQYLPIRERIEQDLFQLERDLLQSCGVVLPDAITTLEEYFKWMTRTDRKPFEPTQHDLDAMRFTFYQKHAEIVRMSYQEFDPVKAWGKYVDTILTFNEEYNEGTIRNGYPEKVGYGLRARTFYQEHRDHQKSQYLTHLKETQDYPGDSLLFHTTSVSNAIDIIASGGLMVGSRLGGSSFSANGLTHPRGGVSKQQSKDHVAFVAEYDQLRSCCNATSFPERSREFEQEIRSPLPTPNGVIIGTVPVELTLFPVTLRTGYAGDTLVGGASIDTWRRHYKETGTLFSDQERQRVASVAGA